MNDTCICDNAPKVWRLTGVTRTLRLRIFNPDGTPLDLTGRTVAVTIARDNSEFVYAPGFVIEGDDNNVVKFEWPADQQGAGDYTINVTTTDGSGNVDRVNWHGPTGIRLVDFSFMVRGEDALGVTSEANIGLDGTFTMNGAGMSAYDEWLAEGHTGTPEEFIAWLRQPAEDAATEAVATVDAKMAEVDADMAAVEATAAADHTRADSDHTTATGDHTRAEADHAQAVTDSQQAATDHQQAEIDAAGAASDREKAATDRTKAANDRQQAAVDHGTAAQDHATASSDHQQAQSDHSIASADHTQATQDAEQAASDHTRAGDDHDTAVADHTRAETDHARAEQDHTASAAATGAANEAAQTATEAAEAADTARESIEGELAKKANVEGYYGGLTAGSAENLVGRGSLEAEIQGIRTSAGQEDIGTGAAIIREVRGKSLVWNQLANNSIFPNETRAGLLFGHDADGTITIKGTASTLETISGWLGLSVNNPIPRSHKLYISRYLISGSVSGTWGFDYNPNRTTRGEQNEKFIVKGSADNSKSIFWFHEGCVFTNAKIALNIIDLTQIFGSGNEPATVEEFERMFFLHYYEHNAGTIINNEATGLRTRGFNLYNPVTGKAVLPGKYSDYPYEYEICGAFTSISFEDYAGNVSTPELTDGRFFNVPSPGVLTVVGGNATDTCVHLVWSGWRNYGEPDYVYEPYWENTLQVNLKTITGKLNGEGESVVIFPEGMRGVGTAYDRLIVDPDGFARRAIRVMYSNVPTTEWNWSVTSNRNFLHSVVPAPKIGDNIIMLGMTKVANTSSTAATPNNGFCIDESTGRIRVKGSDAATTKEIIAEEMAGREIVYELATPLEYVLDTPIPLTYMVDDFGTEAKLPVDTATLPTGPLRFAVTYPFNAVDKLRRQREEMVPADNFDQFLVLLGQAYGGTWNRTYDATTDDQKFTYTPPESEPTGTTENNE